jgi:hypothetical protein
MYNKNHGRFTSIDPIFIKKDRLVDPQRLNLYVYVRNTPTKYKDTDGKDIVLGTKDEKEQKVLKEALIFLAKTESGRKLLTELDKSNVVFSVVIGKALDKKGTENYGKISGTIKGTGENATGTLTVEINVDLIKKDGEANKKTEDFNKNLGEFAKEGGKQLPHPDAPQGKNDTERNAEGLGHEFSHGKSTLNTGKANSEKEATQEVRDIIKDPNKPKTPKPEVFVEEILKPKNP